MFQRWKGPLLVALGFVKDGAMVLAISVLDLLEGRDRYGEANRKESEEVACATLGTAAISSILASL